ncbi:DAK2 domain-containing protein [Heliorestis acidaminivorans]|nr:DAK2 domain-containing protein [Heliorestis acidaminivorans]
MASKSPKDKNYKLSGEDLVRLLQGGAYSVEQKKAQIDQLNVFPVPDGDTGTNMALTLKSAVASLPGEGEKKAGKIATVAAKGALLGARGNSGVIFSQLIWGWAKAIEKNTLVTPQDWAQGMVKGVELAYSAVMKPVEGTILTVAKEAAQEAKKRAKRKDISFEELFLIATEAGQEALSRTPELLPVLKEAGVVDAGGQGYVLFLQGIYKALLGETTEEEGDLQPFLQSVEADWQKRNAFHLTGAKEREATHFTYCTEFILRGTALPLQALRHRLEDIGDSVLVVGDSNVLKCHVHTDRPGLALEKGGFYGTLHDITISNMKDQLRPKSEVAFIASAPSEGWAQLFREQGASAIVMGGSTSNPSAQDWVEAIEKANAAYTILLPNHPNLTMAAGQAIKMIGEDRVMMVPTKHLAGGLVAALAYDSNKSVKDNVQVMTEGYHQVECAEITKAVRDATINGITAKEGQFLGLLNHQLVASGTVIEEVIVQTIERNDEDWELITVYTGAGLEREEIDRVIKTLQERFAEADIEEITAGQPLYPYLIGLE